MARDIRQHKDKSNERCFYYKANYVDKRKLLPNAVVEGVFYARENADFISSQGQNGNVAYKKSDGEIKTNDYVANLEVNDYVYWQGNLYLVAEIRDGAEIFTNQLSMRKAKTTYIRLRK